MTSVWHVSSKGGCDQCAALSHGFSAAAGRRKPVRRHPGPGRMTRRHHPVLATRTLLRIARTRRRTRLKGRPGPSRRTLSVLSLFSHIQG